MRRIHLNFIVCSLALMAGCAPSTSRLSHLVEEASYGKAVAAVADDPTGRRELAAIILESEAKKGNQTARLIDVLSRADRPGDRALKRLEGAKDPAASLAKIALTRRPPKASLDSFLASDYADIRAAACRAWKKRISTETHKQLILDPDHRVRLCALMGLFRDKSSPEDTDAILSEVLRLDPEPAVRSAVARNGHRLGRDPLLKLKRATDDDILGVRLAAIEGLANLGGDTAIAILEDMAHGPMDEMAIVASSALCRLGNDVGSARFTAALEDPRAHIRETALLHSERAKTRNPGWYCSQRER